MNTSLKRSWISPLVAISFFIVSITGLLLMGHAGRGVSHLHEWMGVLFIVTGVLHLMLNWKPFLSCFRSR